MFKRIVIILLCASIFSGLLMAGDIANFVNLGFSDNSGYFMFAQYGIREKSPVAYSDLYVVDLPSNKFVPQGAKTGEFPVSLQPGQDGAGALFTILSENVSLKQKYAINHLSQGRFLYILINGEKPKEILEFRDFISGMQYRVSLVQTQKGEGKSLQSAFFIQLSLTSSDGSIKGYTIGLPEYYRAGVKQYRIRQIILAPDEKSLVFIVEKEELDLTGTNLRFMVETVRIK